MSSEIPLTTIHLVVSQYARGRRAQAIADMTTLPVAEVARIGQQYGAPDLGKLATAAELLRKQLDADEPPTPGSSARDGIDTLRAQAEKLGATKLVRAADAIKIRLDQLRTDLATEAKTQQEDAARRQKRARLAEIEAEAASIRAELTGRKASPAGKSQRSATKERSLIRVWAREHGFQVASYGIIPAAAVEAYEAAHS